MTFIRENNKNKEGRTMRPSLCIDVVLLRSGLSINVKCFHHFRIRC